MIIAAMEKWSQYLLFDVKLGSEIGFYPMKGVLCRLVSLYCDINLQRKLNVFANFFEQTWLCPSVAQLAQALREACTKGVFTLTLACSDCLVSNPRVSE